MWAKIVLYVGGLSLLCTAVQARALEIAGRAGYLSEWEIRGALQGQSGELSGPVAWKHTGLCTVNGPVEKAGTITLKVLGWGPFAKITATMSFGNERCSYSGALSAEVSGAMDCTNAKGIPLNLSIRPAELLLRSATSRE
jgi:hypothetical protein